MEHSARGDASGRYSLRSRVEKFRPNNGRAERLHARNEKRSRVVMRKEARERRQIDFELSKKPSRSSAFSTHCIAGQKVMHIPGGHILRDILPHIKDARILPLMRVSDMWKDLITKEMALQATDQDNHLGVHPRLNLICHAYSRWVKGGHQVGGAWEGLDVFSEERQQQQPRWMPLLIVFLERGPVRRVVHFSASGTTNSTFGKLFEFIKTCSDQIAHFAGHHLPRIVLHFRDPSDLMSVHTVGFPEDVKKVYRPGFNPPQGKDRRRQYWKESTQPHMYENDMGYWDVPKTWAHPRAPLPLNARWL